MLKKTFGTEPLHVVNVLNKCNINSEFSFKLLAGKLLCRIAGALKNIYNEKCTDTRKHYANLQSPSREIVPSGVLVFQGLIGLCLHGGLFFFLIKKS